MLLLQNKVYAVTAAHLLFNKEAQKLYEFIPCNIDSVRHEIANADPARKIAIQVPEAETTGTSDKVFKTIEPHALLAFRYRFKANGEQLSECKQFVNDSVFFQIAKDQAVKWQNQLKRDNPYRREGLTSTNLKQLMDFHKNRQEVVVKSLHGRLISTVDFRRELENGKAVSLTFALEPKNTGEDIP